MSDEHPSPNGPGPGGRPLVGRLLERVEEEGEVALSIGWDDPGTGADADYISELEGKFYLLSGSKGCTGPYGTLDEALEQTRVLHIGPSTREIECKALPAAEVLARCRCDDDLRPGATVCVNQADYVYEGSGRFRPAK